MHDAPLLRACCPPAAARRYVYQGHFDNQGQFWIYTAHRIVICLGVMSSFTSGGWEARAYSIPSTLNQQHLHVCPSIRRACSQRLAGSGSASTGRAPSVAPRVPPTLPAAVLATKGAYAQGLVLFFTCVAFLWWFDT